MNTCLWGLCVLFLNTIGVFACAEELKSEPSHNEEIYLISTIEYGEGGRIAEAAKNECGLEKSIPSAVSKFSDQYAVPIKIMASPDDLKNKKMVLNLKIRDVVGGHPGSGFGGRWVVSELAVTADLMRDGKEYKSNYFACSAGLGFNPLANLKACDRLNRCSEQLGKKITLWLKKSNGTDVPSDEANEN